VPNFDHRLARDWVNSVDDAVDDGAVR